jgi:ATP-dependent Zn protease
MPVPPVSSRGLSPELSDPEGASRAHRKWSRSNGEGRPARAADAAAAASLKSFPRSGLFPLVVIVLLVYLAGQTLLSDGGTRTTTYAEVQRVIRSRSQDVAEVTFKPNEREVVVKLENGKKIAARYPNTQAQVGLERDLAARGGPAGSKHRDSSRSWKIVTALAPFMLLFGFWLFLRERIRRRRASERFVLDAEDMPLESR